MVLLLSMTAHPGDMEATWLHHTSVQSCCCTVGGSVASIQILDSSQQKKEGVVTLQEGGQSGEQCSAWDNTGITSQQRGLIDKVSELPGSLLCPAAWSNC